MSIIFIHQLFLGILAMLLTYSIGKIILSFSEWNDFFFFKLFCTYLIGIITIVFVYSIVKTQGRTIQMVLIPSIIYVFYYFKDTIQRPRFKKEEIIQELCWSIIPFTFVFLYQSWFYFDFSNNSFKSLYADSYWYSAYGDSIHLWSVENYFTPINFFFKAERAGLVPYHYPELWLSSFFANLFSISTVQSNYLIITPILVSSFIIGIASLFDCMILKKAFSILFSIIIIFSCGISLSLYSKYSLLSYSQVASDCSPMGLFGLKYAFILPYLYLAFLLYFRGKRMNACILFSIIPVFYVGLLPAIWGGLLLFLTVSFFIDKKELKYNLILLAFLCVTMIAYILFYAHYKSSFSNDFAFRFAIEKFYNKGHFIFQNIKPFCNNSIVYGIRIIILFIPAFLVFPFIARKNFRLLLLGLLMVGCGIFTSSFYLGFSDGNQFANNSFIILTILSFFGILNLYYLIKNKSKRYSYVLFILFAIYSIYCIAWNINRKKIGEGWYHEDPVFLQTLSKKIKDDNCCVLVFLNAHDYKKNTFISWHLQNDLYLLKQYTNKKIVFSLGNPELYKTVNKFSVVDSFNYYKLTPVIVWRNKSANNNLNSFITHFNIRYCYFKAGVEIPDYIKQNADTIIKSQQTNSTFIILHSH